MGIGRSREVWPTTCGTEGAGGVCGGAHLRLVAVRSLLSRVPVGPKQTRKGSSTFFFREFGSRGPDRWLMSSSGTVGERPDEEDARDFRTTCWGPSPQDFRQNRGKTLQHVSMFSAASECENTFNFLRHCRCLLILLSPHVSDLHLLGWRPLSESLG